MYYVVLYFSNLCSIHLGLRSIMAAIASDLAGTNTHCRIVFKHNRSYVLFLPRPNTHATASVTVEDILRKYHEEQSLCCRLMYRPVVEIATLAPVSEQEKKKKEYTERNK